MPSKINLINQVFRTWKVTDESEKRHFGHVFWKCKCIKCGEKIEIDGKHLREDCFRSCKCESLPHYHIIDMTGQKFEYWEVLKFDKERYFRKKNENDTFWICKCHGCGKIKSVGGSRLRKGRTKSCGCKSLVHLGKDRLIGQKFNKLTIIDEKENKTTSTKVNLLCQCDCGNIREFPRKDILLGGIKSCGCLYFKNNSLKSVNFRLKNRKNTDGYICIYDPEHPNANLTGFVLEHIRVMSFFLNRPLSKQETIHHINGIRSDNRIENLELWASYHKPGQRVEDLVFYAKEILKKYDNYQSPTKLYFQYEIKNPSKTFNTNFNTNNLTTTASSKI